MTLTQITTGGVDENINIDSNTLKVDGTNNRVGIGTASPATALHVSGSGTQRIRITGTGSANAILTLDAPSGFANYIEYGASASTPLAFYDVANTAERMRIDSQGRVGIGTSSPDQMLHLSNNSGPVLRFENTDTTIASGNSFGAIEFESRDSSSSAGVVAKIEGFAPNTMDGTATNGGALRFSTATVNPVSLSERMRIDSSGNTTFKYADSSTSTSTQVPPGLRINNTDNTSGRLAGIHFSHGGAGTANAGIFHVTTNTATGSTTCLGDLAFYMKASGSSTMTERMRIDSSGRVGIGTTATQQILTIDVNDSGTAPGSFNGINIANTNTTANNGSAITFGQTVPGNSNARIGVIQTARGPSESQEMFFGLLGSGAYSEVMRLDSSGRLLVGTSSALTATNAQYSNFIVRGASSGSSFDGRMSLSRGAAASSLSSGNTVGSIYFTDNDSNEFAAITATVDGTTGASDAPGRLAFSTTADGASSPTERMRIGNAGHIGFGGEFDLSASNRVSINPADGLIGLGMDGRESYVTGLSGCYIYSGSGATGTTKAGEVIIQSRSNVNRDITFVTGTTPAKRLSVYGSGSVQVHGAFSKGSGSFKIDHPLPAKTATHNLVHSFIEGPQADLIYRGKVDLTAGAATVNLDTAARMTEGTFVLLNTNVQCFTSNESDWTAVRGSVSGNTLTIAAEDNTSTATVSWLVIGERQDQHMLDTDWTDDNGRVITEPEKPS